MATKRKTKEMPFQPAGGSRRVIPLQGGWAYLFDHLGKRRHMKRDSVEFAQLVAAEDEFFKGKIKAEIDALGWELAELPEPTGDES
jgi:hypothetical protein